MCLRATSRCGGCGACPAWARRRRGPWFAARRCRFCRARGREGSSSACLTIGIVGGHAGVEQCERAERGDAAFVAGQFGPVAARQLFALEIGTAVVDGGENLGGVDRPLSGGLRLLRECGSRRYNRYDRQRSQRGSALGEKSSHILRERCGKASLSSLRFRGCSGNATATKRLSLLYSHL